MQQAMPSLIRLFETYKAADTEKRRVYALWDDAMTDADVVAAEIACDLAYDAVEGIADAILAAPIRSAADANLKAQVLLAHGSAPADLFYYRPDDLRRFVQEVSSLALP